MFWADRHHTFRSSRRPSLNSERCREARRRRILPKGLVSQRSGFWSARPRCSPSAAPRCDAVRQRSSRRQRRSAQTDARGARSTGSSSATWRRRARFSGGSATTPDGRATGADLQRMATGRLGPCGADRPVAASGVEPGRHGDRARPRRPHPTSARPGPACSPPGDRSRRTRRLDLHRRVRAGAHQRARRSAGDDALAGGG